ncbi:hypothetical protein [Streptomyces sp. Caat 7-52]|uniref:hypothetical protein n=1 Tax=Streptomyces sp. Caat 7-52 TaxID=2949637 RepID=UPI00203629EC|nr:hypothetical protein [Streptomyces sp. Caat 7-52]
MRIEWIWLLPIGALLLLAFDCGGGARLMWDMQPAAKHIKGIGPVCLRVLAAILASAATLTRLVHPAGG